jgi:hypothetical protein
MRINCRPTWPMQLRDIHPMPCARCSLFGHCGVYLARLASAHVSHLYRACYDVFQAFSEHARAPSDRQVSTLQRRQRSRTHSERKLRLLFAFGAAKRAPTALRHYTAENLSCTPSVLAFCAVGAQRHAGGVLTCVLHCMYHVHAVVAREKKRKRTSHIPLRSECLLPAFLPALSSSFLPLSLALPRESPRYTVHRFCTPRTVLSLPRRRARNRVDLIASIVARSASFVHACVPARHIVGRGVAGVASRGAWGSRQGWDGLGK